MTKERNILCNNCKQVAVQKRNDKTEDVPLFYIKREILRTVKNVNLFLCLIC
jgi:hypothetical protein